MAPAHQVSVKISATGFSEFNKTIESVRKRLIELIALFPKFGGTYLYCVHSEKKGHTETRCVWRNKIHPNGLAKYRRHYRRDHGGLPADHQGG